MCGILGGNIEDWDYATGIEAMRHRGPDAQRIRRFNECTLAFARLSIMDLSMEAMQPMESEDKQIAIVFNGEIYGFNKLRNTLKEKYLFKTTSDTEVILYAYMEYGERFVEYIDGMYSIVIYDKRSSLLKIYRDRYGIKPLYYYYEDDKFAFASELKALIKASENIKLWKIDNTAIYDYLFCGYIPEPKCMYKNIRRLEPANYIIYDLKSKKIIRKDRYWRLHVSTRAHGTRKHQDIKEEVRYLIEQSIKEQMVADVKVGTYLSGGVDSSIISYECNKVNPEISAFSIGFPEEEYDETAYAKLVADSCSINHKVKYFENHDYLSMKGLLHQLYDEPFADTSAYPTYFLSRFAKEEVKVVLTGDGGDELFGGYDRYYRFSQLEKNFSSENRDIEKIINRIFTENTVVSNKIRERFQTKFTTYCKLMGEYDCIYYDKFKKVLNIDKDYNSKWYFEKYYVKDLPLMTRLRYLDFKTYLPSDILTKVDRASMAVSLEARVPLLNRKLVEYVFGLAENECCSTDNLKGILKEAYKDVIPTEVLYREKKGFAVPRSFFKLRADSLNNYIDIWKREWNSIK